MAAPAARSAPGWTHPTDLGGAVALAAFCIVVGRKQPLTFPGARPADLAQAVIIAVACLGLALRRSMPSVSVLIGSAGVALYLGCSYTGGPVLLVPLVGMFFAGYHLTRARVWQLAGAFAVFLAVAVVTTDAPAAQVWVWLLAWPPIAAALGLAGAARRRHELDLAERDEEEDRRQHAEARRQLAEARLQTARDLHDVIGHSLASITILAGAGSRRVETDPAAAKEVLDEIRAVSATALSDVRRPTGARRAQRPGSGVPRRRRRRPRPPDRTAPSRGPRRGRPDRGRPGLAGPGRGDGAPPHRAGVVDQRDAAFGLAPRVDRRPAVPRGRAHDRVR